MEGENDLYDHFKRELNPNQTSEKNIEKIKTDLAEKRSVHSCIN